MTSIDTDSAFLKSLRINLSRLIAYAESADWKLQREVKHLYRMILIATKN
jgi:hypothetical protein